MMSVKMKKATAWAIEYDEKLLATDPRLACNVRLILDDGSTLFFDSAFIVTIKEHEDFLFVFTEHHGYLVFSLDEVYDFRQLERAFHTCIE